MLVSFWGCLMPLLIGVQFSEGAKILAFFTAPSQSHMNLKSALLKELVTRGHHVTVVTALEDKTPTENYVEILVPGIMDALRKVVGPNIYESDRQNFMKIAFESWAASESMCRTVLSEPNVQKLINSKNQNFDLLILEAFFSECYIPFGEIFKIPIIKFCTFGGTHWMGDWVGNPNPYSYVPDAFYEYSDRMDFWERSINAFTGLFYKLGRHFYFLPRMDSVVREFFNETEPLPPLWELDQSSTSLLLVNSHFSISYPRPLVPNLVQVGGLHVKPPKKLPADLQKYLDESPHGVIYFSMGSILRSSALPDSKRNALLGAFSKIKQNVLWKWENDSLPGQPKNVKLSKWFPQSDILAHPNVRALTHGGLLSSQESIYRGVPMVGIPIFGDQRLNMERAKSAEYGIILDFKTLSTSSVSLALNEVLNNPKYRENAQRISRIYRDQPLQPLDQAVYWTEYVIRHKGAPHMRSAALDLTWYQYFLLDVIAALLLAFCLCIFVIIHIFKCLVNRVRGSRSDSDKKNK